METIPTPRTDAVAGGETPMGIWKYVTEGPHVPIRYAHQLERELHIAKQALERIVKEKGRPMSMRVSGPEGIAELAIEQLNTLSA